VLHQLLTGVDPSQTPFQFKTFSINIPTLEALVMSMVQINEVKRPASMKNVREILQQIAQKLTKNDADMTEKKIAQNVAKSPSIGPVNLYVLTSMAQQDQQIWQSIQNQLEVLISNIPNIHIYHNSTLSQQDNPTRNAAIDCANMLLVVLSEDFLTSPTCMADVKRALDYVGTRKVKILSLLARPCSWPKTPLAHIPQILPTPIMHLSHYAQEQQIAAAARAIRKQLTALILNEQRAGPMNLLQWLMWQLYDNGSTICPYFVVKQYALKYIRSSGHTGVYFQLLDLRTGQVIADYAISSHNSKRLTSLLQIIAPSCAAPLYVLGVAMSKRPQ
jgi:hypothetical protein